MKKVICALLTICMAAGLFVAAPLNADAKDRIFGDTPDYLDNRVVVGENTIIYPTVVTNYHAETIRALVPTSSKEDFDKATGVDKSIYADAATYVYVVDNYQFGTEAKKSINAKLTEAGAQNLATVTLNLIKYEGYAYKGITSTEQELEFKLGLTDTQKKANKDYAVLRLNKDGSVTVLLDQDTDAGVVTFKTNSFEANNVYCLAMVDKGGFDKYKPVEEKPVVKKTTKKRTSKR